MPLLPLCRECALRQHRSGSTLDDSPLTGEIDPLSEAVEATRLNSAIPMLGHTPRVVLAHTG